MFINIVLYYNWAKAQNINYLNYHALKGVVIELIIA